MVTQAEKSPQVGGHRVCPWWMAYLFDNFLRRMINPAEKVLGPYVKPGMTVLDFGCGFGHFSLGMARLAGKTGQVVAADLQEKMLAKTMARARRAGLDKIIQPHQCSDHGIGATPTLDFALACNSLHETPDPASTLGELFALLKPGARLLVMEPLGHLKAGEFEAEVALAKKAGFEEIDRPGITREISVLLEKPASSRLP